MNMDRVALRELIGVVAERLMALAVEGLCGAGRSASSMSDKVIHSD